MDENYQNVKSTGSMSEEIAEASEQMERRFARAERAETTERTGKVGKVESIGGYGLFTLSAAVSLIYIGAILLWSALVTGDVVAAFRLSPAILIFIGAEILYNKLKRNLRIRLSPDCILAAFLILFTFLLSMASVSLEDSGAARILAQERLAGEIKSKISKDVRKSDFESLSGADIDVTLNGRSAGSYSSIRSIKPSDSIDARFYFDGTQGSLNEFAADCRLMLDIISHYHLPFEQVEFFSVDRFNRLHVKTDLSFGDFMSEEDIARETDYYISDLDFDFDLVGVE